MPAVLEPLKLQRQVVRRVGAAVTGRIVMADYTMMCTTGGSGFTCTCGDTTGCNTNLCVTNNAQECYTADRCPVETDGCPPETSEYGCTGGHGCGASIQVICL